MIRNLRKERDTLLDVLNDIKKYKEKKQREIDSGLFTEIVQQSKKNQIKGLEVAERIISERVEKLAEKISKEITELGAEDEQKTK